MPHARLPFLLPLLIVASCDLGPDYVRPALDIPPAFRATAVSAEKAWPPTEWWHAFGSAELDGLIADARAHNQDLAAAAARIVQANATVAINGAPLLPALNATGGASYSRTGSSRSGGVSGITTGGGAITTTTTSANGTTTQTTSSTGSTVVSGRSSHYSDARQYNLQGSISYEADFWGKNRATYESAKASALATAFDQQTVALTVVTSVATTYFQALGAADRLTVARHNLADARSSLNVFQVRMEVGTATALDVAQEEALVAGQAAQIPLLQSTLDQQVIGLGILVGRPPEDIHITADTLNTLPVPPIGVGLPSELLARRPDVANAEANLLAQNGNVRAARAAFFPDLTLTSQGGIESLALSTLLGPGNFFFTAASSVTQTIFDNGLKQGDLDFEKGRFSELIATYRQAVLQAFTDVDVALTQVRYTAEQEALVREAVRVAQRAADIARAQLAAGTVDITTVLNTQTTLYGDQDTLASVRLTHFQALINLYKALGGGFTSASVPRVPMKLGRIFLVTVLLAGTGYAGYAWYAHKAAPAQIAARRHRGGTADDPIPVLATVATTKDVPIYLDALGTVQAFNTVNIKVMVDGPLTEVRFHEGQDVKTGDVLAKIDARTYQATYDQAVAKKAQDEALLANARVDLARYQKLAATAYTSGQTSDTQRSLVAQYEAQVRQDQAQIDTAKTNLSYTTVVAPLDGRTGMRQVDQGNIVHSGDTTPLTVITQLHPISVVFTLAQQSLPVVASAMAKAPPEVLALAQGGSGAVIDRGQVAVLDNTVDQSTGTIKLKATFPNENLVLWPGGFVNVRLLVQTERDVTTVPPVAVQRGPQGTYVYLLGADDTVTRKVVQVGHEDEQVSIITGGLRPGDQVIVDGASRLTDGAKVKVTSPTEPVADTPPHQRRRRASSTP